MNELTIFKNADFGEVRTVMQDGEPWFVAADVCRALEIGNTSQALSRLDNDERFTTLISNEGAATGKSNMAFINEPGLYSLVLGSRKPEAKAFKRWITHEVIPSIRKTGVYAAPTVDSEMMFKIAQAMQEKEAQIARLEMQKEEMKPKALFADAVSASKTSILVGDLAKLIRQNGFEIGQKRLFKWLRDKGYLIRQNGASWNMPTQYSMERGLFEVKETAVTHADGHVSISKTPKVTGKGQVFFINVFLENGLSEDEVKLLYEMEE